MCLNTRPSVAVLTKLSPIKCTFAPQPVRIPGRTTTSRTMLMSSSSTMVCTATLKDRRVRPEHVLTLPPLRKRGTRTWQCTRTKPHGIAPVQRVFTATERLSSFPVINDRFSRGKRTEHPWGARIASSADTMCDETTSRCKARWLRLPHIARAAPRGWKQSHEELMSPQANATTPATVSHTACRPAWARLIGKVYERDP